MSELIAISELVESPLNPRKSYNVGKMQDLIESVRKQGIREDLLVRNNPKLGGREIISGHRRYRAAKAAELTHAPCKILKLSDDEALELLLMANLQREDVHPMEEADGFQTLLDRPGQSIAAIASKIGKTEAYVYGRLELINLQPVVREAFLRDSITIGHAKLIARLDPDMQKEALAASFSRWGAEELLPIRDLRRWLERNSARDLAKAPFPMEDPSLIVQACSVCSCAVGVNPLLVAVDGEKLCTNPTCYDAKVEAFVAAQVRDKELVTISTVYADKAVPAGVQPAGEYTEVYLEPDPDDALEIQELEESIAAAEDPEEKKEFEEQLVDLRGQIEEQLKDCGFSEDAIVAHGKDKGKITRICRNPACPEHGARVNRGGKQKDEAEEARLKAEKEKEELERKIEQVSAFRILRAIMRSENAYFFYSARREFGQRIARKLIGYGAISGDLILAMELPWLAGRELKSDKDVKDQLQSLIDATEGSPASDELPRVMLALLCKDAFTNWPTTEAIDELHQIADLMEVDWQQIGKSVVKELTPKPEPKAKKAAATKKKK